MFDEKEEDDGVADYGECPNNDEENETGKKNLKDPRKISHVHNINGIFTILTHWGMSGETR